MTSGSLTRWRGAAAVLAAAGLATACSSVNLSDYTPPPIQSPGGSSTGQGASATGAETHPVGEPAMPSAVPEPPVIGQDNTTTQPGAELPGSAELPQSSGASSNLVALSARMDGASVVPRVATIASGQLVAQYDRTTKLLRWKASWSDLSSPITGVQFRGPADPTMNAPLTVTWPAPFGIRYDGNVVLNVTQSDDLLHGLWYVTVLTANYPQGEIRGQVKVVQ